ncbi:MAG: agmatine/peptidylarginine deiminase [Yoonia sp.]|jgi:agmatine/peptidylarginine deiminase
MQRRRFVKGRLAMAANTVPRFGQAAPLGFFVPVEEVPHQRSFMQWPVNRRVHPDPVFLDMAQQMIADIANAIADFEPVIMLAAGSDHANARGKLSDAVELWYVPTEDLWCRDAGPNRVLINLPDDPDPRDPFHSAALDPHDVLITAGLQVEVIPEPVKRRIKSIDFVGSYANYYVCNGAVIAA